MVAVVSLFWRIVETDGHPESTRRQLFPLGPYDTEHFVARVWGLGGECNHKEVVRACNGSMCENGSADGAWSVKVSVGHYIIIVAVASCTGKQHVGGTDEPNSSGGIPADPTQRRSSASSAGLTGTYGLGAP